MESVCVQCRNGSEENLNINHNEEVREDNLRTKCTFTKKGICNTHGTPSTKISIPSQKWKDRGGGRGFGLVKTRTRRFICRARNILPADTENSTRSLIADMSQDISGLSSNQGISDKSMESSRKLENIGK